MNSRVSPEERAAWRDRVRRGEVAAGLPTVPEYMHASVIDWIAFGEQPQAFLLAVLCNNQADAVKFADTTNGQHLLRWGEFVLRYLPCDSWGSAAKVAAWNSHGGLSGLRPLNERTEANRGQDADQETETNQGRQVGRSPEATSGA